MRSQDARNRSRNMVYKVTNSTGRSELFIASNSHAAKVMASQPIEAGGYRLVRDYMSKSIKAESMLWAQADPHLRALIKTGQTGQIVRGWSVPEQVSQFHSPVALQTGPWQLLMSWYAVTQSGEFYGPFPNSYQIYKASQAWMVPKEYTAVMCSSAPLTGQTRIVDWTRIGKET